MSLTLINIPLVFSSSLQLLKDELSFNNRKTVLLFSSQAGFWTHLLWDHVWILFDNWFFFFFYSVHDLNSFEIDQVLKYLVLVWWRVDLSALCKWFYWQMEWDECLTMAWGEQHQTKCFYVFPTIAVQEFADFVCQSFLFTERKGHFTSNTTAHCRTITLSSLWGACNRETMTGDTWRCSE